MDSKKDRKFEDLEKREKDLVILRERLNLVLEEKDKELSLLKRALGKATSRSEEINKEFDEFVYFASHDLKGSLRSIEAFSKFLHEDYRDILDEKGREYLEVLNESIQRLKAQVASLGELAKIREDASSNEEFNLKKMVIKSILSLKDLIKKKKPKFSFYNLNVGAYGNPLLIEKVLSNLISNGLIFNDKKKITLEIGSINKEEAFSVYVKDNGIGIEEFYFERIFQIFQRVGTKNHSGVGAGLTICNKVIEKHRGNIWVESKVSKGSTFFFTLPPKKS
ncbi:hypothetical protein KKB84_04015 [bacterium]|nr:hypothetical protein [bacterium]